MEINENKKIAENKENENQIQPQNLQTNSQNQNNINQQQQNQISFKKPNERVKTKVIHIIYNFKFLIFFKIRM